MRSNVRRRTVLAAAGTFSLAGCLGDSTSPETDDPASGNGNGNGDGDEPNGNSSDDDPDADGDDPEGSNADEPAPDEFDAVLERPGYVLSMNQQFAEAGPDDVTALDEVNETTREAVTAAIESGRYETDEASDALLEGLHRLWYVSRRGTVYEVSWTMPEHVVTATEVDQSDVDPDATIGLRDDRLRALGPDNREIIGAVNTVVGRDGPTGREYRAPVLDEELASFLESYDYVAYPDDGEDGPDPEGYVELALSHEDPGPPYAVTVETLPMEERYGAPVVDVDSFSTDVREALETAAEHRELRTDDLPDGLRDAVAAEGYVRVGDEVYEPTLQDVAAAADPISLEITDVDADGTAFTLALETDREDGVTIFHGAPNPFGVLSATDADGERATLWSDDYEESDHVHVDDRDGERTVAVNDIGLTTDLGPDATIEATYEVDPEWGFEGGDWTVEDTLALELDDESVPYPYTVELAVPELAE